MTFHGIGHHPQRDNEAVEEQQRAHQGYQLRVLQHLILAHSPAATVRKYPVDAVRLGEHGAKGEREAGRQEVDTCLGILEGRREI